MARKAIHRELHGKKVDHTKAYSVVGQRGQLRVEKAPEKVSKDEVEEKAPAVTEVPKVDEKEKEEPQKEILVTQTKEDALSEAEEVHIKEGCKDEDCQEEVCKEDLHSKESCTKEDCEEKVCQEEEKPKPSPRKTTTAKKKTTKRGRPRKASVAKKEE